MEDKYINNPIVYLESGPHCVMLKTLQMVPNAAMSGTPHVTSLVREG